MRNQPVNQLRNGRLATARLPRQNHAFARTDFKVQILDDRIVQGICVRERNVLGVIASVNIQDLVEVEKGYFPYIVVDNKNYENNKTIEVVSNNEEYTIKIDKKPKVDNYTCVMIKGSFNNKYRIKLIDDLKEAKLKEKADE